MKRLSRLLAISPERDLFANRPLQFPSNPHYPPIPEELKAEARAISPEIPVADRGGFKEVELAFAENEAVREANRCLNCDVLGMYGMRQGVVPPGGRSFHERRIPEWSKSARSSWPRL